MADNFFFLGLPYLSLGVLVVGTLYRFWRRPYGVSSLSSQVLEDRILVFGSVPWHAGVLVLLAGHLVPFVAPGLWSALIGYRPFLLAVEATGLAAAVLALAGLVVLLARRVLVGRLQAVTRVADFAVLALLIAQVVTGLLVALSFRWGSMWSLGTLWPYVWGVLTLRPDPALVVELPMLVKLHVIGAWLIGLLVPFSRLVHAFVLPLGYLTRAPQRVIWSTRLRLDAAQGALETVADEGRRLALRGLMAVSATAALVTVGVLDKFVGFFHGDAMSEADKQKLMAKKLERARGTATERGLEVERMQSELIRVGRLGDIQKTRGTYFIDYQMRPALAFRGADGLPLLISAKCTHLGCTVGSELDAQGRILCPCHISYFDLSTGRPNPGAPAKDPLAHLGWVLKEGDAEVASQTPDGARVGSVEAERLDSYELYIARRHVEGKA